MSSETCERLPSHGGDLFRGPKVQPYTPPHEARMYGLGVCRNLGYKNPTYFAISVEFNICSRFVTWRFMLLLSVRVVYSDEKSLPGLLSVLWFLGFDP